MLNRTGPATWCAYLTVACLTAFTLHPAVAQDESHQHGQHRQGQHQHPHDNHYDHRFENAERWAEQFNDPARDEWQKPQAVIQAMGLKKGMRVADLGTGTGYFIPHLSHAVGKKGTVLAVDIEPSMLQYVHKHTRKGGLTNVDTVLAQPTKPRIPASSVDRILAVNTWHHIPNRSAYSEHLASRLRPGGSVWVVDFTRDAPMGPPKQHRLSPEEVIRELGQGGFNANLRDIGLPHQYVIVGELP